ncbi:amidohydrolase family protein [Tardiphaga sp.]|uniref:amidohydrolase family protein n=1 Tax=Tardiphaga sp. TaxID=1926292 RepID=UPI0025EAC811|nr:amidohydrolase family protein [Tardiphaga sp.]
MTSTNNVAPGDFSQFNFDTEAHLANAHAQSQTRRYDDFLIVDVDSHHYETEAFGEIAEYIEDPVLRQEAKYQGMSRGGVTSVDGSYQEMAGRVLRYPLRKSEKVPLTIHRDITLMRRWMDAMGVDMACMFPTPMLNISTCPRVQVEVELARAYNRWLCDNILAEEPRLTSMLYLPFNDPEACHRMVEEFGDRKGVIGFMVTATHYKGVHDNAYVKTYAALQERNLPIGFHAAYTWGDSMMSLTNRFISVHALGFVLHNMVHMMNWLVNGMPERFPKLKTVWIESGLAWIPFLMQRLDNEYMMRSSDAPLLKRKPSDYMREMFYTSQPMEMVDNREALELTFKMINAKSQLLYSSDYPHWDMDLPSTIYDLPFLNEQSKRDILGGNAQKLFNLDPVFSAEKLRRRSMVSAAE